MKRSRLARKAPLRAKRWGITRKPRRPRAGDNPVRKAWARTQPCVGLTEFPDHVCWNPGDHNDPSHIRDFTGMGLQPNDDKVITKCRLLHDEWETRSGHFDGWSNERRKAWAYRLLALANAAYAKVAA